MLSSLTWRNSALLEIPHVCISLDGRILQFLNHPPIFETEIANRPTLERWMPKYPTSSSSQLGQQLLALFQGLHFIRTRRSEGHSFLECLQEFTEVGGLNAYEGGKSNIRSLRTNSLVSPPDRWVQQGIRAQRQPAFRSNRFPVCA